MKGMLYKNFATMKRVALLYLAVIVFFAAFNGESGAVFAMCYSIMLPVTMISYDERARFDRLMMALPLRTIDCVLDKYLVSYGCMALVCLVCLVRAVILGSWLALPQMLLPGLIVCLLFTSVTLPLVFRFGVEKGRAVYMLSMIVQALILAGLGSMLDVQAITLRAAAALPALLAALAVSAGSVFVSAKCYERRMTA